MEKVFIQNCVNTGRTTKDGKTVYEIELQDGRKCTSFGTDFSGFILQEIEAEVRDSGKEFGGNKIYWINLPKPAGQGGKFPAKDWNYDKRKTALSLSVEFSKGKDVKSADVMKVAESFLEWLKQS